MGQGIDKEKNEELKKVTLNNVVILNKELGSGSYGSVFTVKYDGVICAAKKIHSHLIDNASFDQKSKVKNNFIKECICCSNIQHPNIVEFLGVYYPSGGGLPIMVMELMDTSLAKFIEIKKIKISIQTKISILYDVSQGLSFLHNHEPQIIHRDLSSNNVMLKGSPIVTKIGDMGVAKMVRADNKKTKSKLTQVPGTEDFMPPEALVTDNPVYSTPVDVFSFGGIALHVFSEEWPAPGYPKTKDPATGKYIALSEPERRQRYLDKMTGEAAVLREMTERCLSDEPKTRPPIIEVSMFIESLKV